MESRDWRSGWGADDPRWTGDAAADPRWAGTNGGTAWDGSAWSGHTATAGWGVPPIDQPHPLTSTSTGGLPALRGPSGGHLPVRPGFGLSAAIPTQPLVESSSRRIRTGRRAREEFDDEPPYGKVLGLTVGWFLVPALLFVAWRLLASTERTHDVGASVPWVLAAVGLSVIVAALLRWAIVGWRALTLSFAAAVIGSGVATIAHSLAA